MRPTPARAIIVAAIFGGLGGWLIRATTRALGMDAPQVPWTTPILLGVLAVAVAVLARTTYLRIHKRHERMEPQRAVALLVLGKAATLAGAAVAGGYLVFGLLFVPQLQAVGPRDRVIRSAVALICAIAMTIAGVLLERACRVPEPPDEDGPRDDRSRTGSR